jgi:hypothetical protein
MGMAVLFTRILPRLRPQSGRPDSPQALPTVSSRQKKQRHPKAAL